MIQEKDNHVIALLREDETIVEIRIPLVDKKPPVHINYTTQGVRKRCTFVGYADGAPYYRIDPITI